MGICYVFMLMKWHISTHPNFFQTKAFVKLYRRDEVTNRGEKDTSFNILLIQFCFWREFYDLVLEKHH